MIMGFLTNFVPLTFVSKSIRNRTCMKIFIPKWSPTLMLTLIPFGLSAQWSSNSATNTLVCSAAYDQKNPDMVIDSEGNTFIVWADDRSGYGLSDIYAQKLDASGNIQWTANGVAVCTDANVQYYPRVISDNAGGIFIVWQDHRGPNGPNGQSDIYAQRLDANGNALWTSNGIGVCTYSQYQYTPQLVTDGSGGAIIVWKDNRPSSKSQLYAQRIDADGNALWTADGVLIGADYYSQYLADPGNPEYQNNIVTDGNHGAIIVWKGYYWKYSVYAQRIDGNGTAKWNSGLPVAIYKTSVADAHHIGIASDINNGAIISWDQTPTSGYPDIYAQKIDTSGNIKWASGGIAICKAGLYQRNPFPASDKKGGAYIVWQDLRNNSDNDIYANHVDSMGIGHINWGTDVDGDGGPDGIVINNEASDQTLPIAASDDDGNLIACYYVSYQSIKIQKIGIDGSVQWTANGISPATSIGQKVYSHFSVFENKPVLVWAENRSGASYSNLYIQLLDSDGAIGNATLPVELVSFSLSGNRLNWTTASETNNAGWEIEERIQETEDRSQNSGWKKIGFISGKGKTTEKQIYSFTLPITHNALQLQYRLKQIDTDGKFEYSNILTVNLLPETCSLSQNYPNPFNPSTIINYQLSGGSFVTLKIYDMLGREIKTLVSKHEDAGNYSVKFDSENLPSGVYFCKLQADQFSEIKKMMLVK